MKYIGFYLENTLINFKMSLQLQKKFTVHHIPCRWLQTEIVVLIHHFLGLIYSLAFLE